MAARAFWYNSDMEQVETSVVLNSDVTPAQKQSIWDLQMECFGDLDKKRVLEDFIAESFGKVFASREEEIIGMALLFKRNVQFARKDIVLGGIGAICVTEAMRGKGIATEIMKKGLEVLRREQCDMACLNADPPESAPLYEKVGFAPMRRPASFENSKGDIKYVNGTMVAPIHSQELYEYVVNTNETFHYGRGYW